MMMDWMVRKTLLFLPSLLHSYNLNTFKLDIHFCSDIAISAPFTETNTNNPGTVYIYHGIRSSSRILTDEPQQVIIKTCPHAIPVLACNIEKLGSESGDKARSRQL